MELDQMHCKNIYFNNTYFFNKLNIFLFSSFYFFQIIYRFYNQFGIFMGPPDVLFVIESNIYIYIYIYMYIIFLFILYIYILFFYIYIYNIYWCMYTKN